MFANFSTADYYAYLISKFDHSCRKDLIAKSLVSERDYVTAFSTRVRDGMKKEMISCHAQTITPQIEKENGVDGIIIFRLGNEVKIGIYEAKWPRFLELNYSWDKLHDDRLTSHFSEQIIKQKKFQKDIAVWEMFFNEVKFGENSPPLEYFGSSCVWYQEAYNFMINEKLIDSKWTTDKLKGLLLGNGTNLYQIIFDILSCRKGTKQLVNSDDKVVINSSLGSDGVFTIPVPNSNTKDFDERIDVFLREFNIDSYLYLNISRMED